MHEAVLVKSPPAPIGVITNPNSKRNRRREGWHPRKEELQATLGAYGVVVETATIDEIRPALASLLERRVRYLVSDGGDGALHWLLNEAWELVGRDPARLPRIVPTHGGTINFVARKARIRGAADRILAALVESERSGREPDLVEIPTMVLRGVERGAPFERLGFCVALAGLGQRFFDRYYRYRAPGPMTVVKIMTWGLLSCICNLPGLRRIMPLRWKSYLTDLARPYHAAVRIDGDPLPGTSWRAIHAGAFPVNIGGVVRFFPLASGGKLHVTAGTPTLPQLAANLPRALLGTRLSRAFIERAAQRFEVEALGPELLHPVIDGERFFDLLQVDLTPGPVISVPSVRA